MSVLNYNKVDSMYSFDVKGTDVVVKLRVVDHSTAAVWAEGNVNASLVVTDWSGRPAFRIQDVFLIEAEKSYSIVYDERPVIRIGVCKIEAEITLG